MGSVLDGPFKALLSRRLDSNSALCTGRRQVFGLAGSELSYWPLLPSSREPVHLLLDGCALSGLHSQPFVYTAVVPAYRCGTVPDSHRIPLVDDEADSSTL